MSAVTADVLVERDVANDALDPRRTESKFSLAMDAVTRDKEHAGDSVRAYLEVLLDVLNNLTVVQTRDGAFDVRILATIDASRDFVNQLRNLLAVIAETGSADRYTPALKSFLEGVLQLKKQYPIGDDAAYLWRDALGFICREIFVSTIAALVANGAWSSVRALLEHEYRVTEVSEPFGFDAFDGFQRSLDVFRNRRLKLGRVSVAADILRERVKESALAFDQITQADFVLHVYSLIRDAPSMRRWHARTLGFAHEQQVTGFDVFVHARAGKAGESVTVLFDLPDWTALYEALAARIEDADTCARTGLDYAGFLAATNAIFRH